MILNLFIFNLKRIKLIFQNILKKFLFELGYDIYFNRISKFEIELSKFKRKKNKLVKYEDQKKKRLIKLKDFQDHKYLKSGKR